METPGQVTQLLRNLDNDDPAVVERLLPLVYNELRRLAAHYMRGEKPGQTIQATELVHEAYLRVVGQQDLQWQGKAHFMAMAATSMRRILVDRACRKLAARHDGDEEKVKLDEALVVSPEKSKDLVALADAIVHPPGPGRRASLFRRLGDGRDRSPRRLVLASGEARLEPGRAWLNREIERTA